MPTRRHLLIGGLTAALPAALGAHARPAETGEGGGAPTVERFALWPDQPPGGAGLAVADQFVKRSATGGDDDIAWTHVATPMLTVVRPARPTGAAVLLCPGGGYVRVAVGRTGRGLATTLAMQGITAFELLYRLPHDGWANAADVPLQDAQRAMRVIRAGAGTRWRVDPSRVAAMGFSAGGHVASRLATRSALPVYTPVDAVDRLSARPAVAGLFYPVVTMRDDGAHRQSRHELLGAHEGDPDWQRRYSTELDLPTDTPPCFVSCNADDPVVPMKNSLLIAEALHAARIPAELMVFEHGGHGPPAPHRDGTAVPWLDLFTAWSRDHGWPA